jgi:hypothetical protein
MQLSLLPKLVEKLFLVPVISFCKIFTPSYGLDALLCPNWPFSPPNRVTVWRTLLCQKWQLNGAWNLENEQKQCIHVLHELAYYTQSPNGRY